MIPPYFPGRSVAPTTAKEVPGSSSNEMRSLIVCSTPYPAPLIPSGLSLNCGARVSEPSASSGKEKRAVAAGELRRALRHSQGRRGPERRRHQLGDGPLAVVGDPAAQTTNLVVDAV